MLSILNVPVRPIERQTRPQTRLSDYRYKGKDAAENLVYELGISVEE